MQLFDLARRAPYKIVEGLCLMNCSLHRPGTFCNLVVFCVCSPLSMREVAYSGECASVKFGHFLVKVS